MHFLDLESNFNLFAFKVEAKHKEPKTFRLVISGRVLCKISKGDLCNKAQISKGTMAKMTNNEPVTLTVIEKICDVLQCDIGDVVQIADINKDRR